MPPPSLPVAGARPRVEERGTTRGPVGKGLVLLPADKPSAPDRRSQTERVVVSRLLLLPSSTCHQLAKQTLDGSHTSGVLKGV